MQGLTLVDIHIHIFSYFTQRNSNWTRYIARKAKHVTYVCDFYEQPRLPCTLLSCPRTNQLKKYTPSSFQEFKNVGTKSEAFNYPFNHLFRKKLTSCSKSSKDIILVFWQEYILKLLTKDVIRLGCFGINLPHGCVRSQFFIQNEALLYTFLPALLTYQLPMSFQNTPRF